MFLAFANVANVSYTGGLNTININKFTNSFNIINNGVYANTEYPILDIVHTGDTISVSPVGGFATVSSVDYVHNVIYLNSNLSGSISLRGALIDDIILKNYRETLDKNSKPIVLLSPKKSEDGYFVESGWATAKSDIKVPDNNSVWQIREGKKLTPTSPITLEWNNKEGIVFSKKIEIDDKYLFKVTETIKNEKNKTAELFHYSQITKNTKPHTDAFYILHEGLIGVVDKNLKEETYTTIEKEKKTYNGKSGWFGITDKYWMAAIIPENGKSFKGEYSYANAYKANFIISEPTIANPQKSASSSFKIFLGAKEVHTVDSYTEKEKIENEKKQEELLAQAQKIKQYIEQIFFIKNIKYEKEKYN